MSWNRDEAEENQERVQREITKRRARGELLTALEVPQKSRKLCQSFWGQAWCRNLESYQHYEARLPAGRSYLRHGKVLDLTLEPGTVSAVVAGSELYDTLIHIRPLAPDQWQETVHASQGQVNSLLDLLSGQLGDGLMKILTDPDQGLFPKPQEIRFDCSCPDHADLCKHASAVLYGVGVLLDTRPELLFTLRGVDQTDLLSSASSSSAATLGTNDGELKGTDLSALFGIDLAE
ncbi:putative Zn finger protein [Prosthecobacter fusiformis]|uniref:Putative Zn finger protein n=1 Tax=Prosthecobacter fusiformis TaxID=48464 RepID=A0A4R7SR56_9BACT|nr:SWIM zinc finger family protein [Prosthecobacter fusiformis]TDU81165.1 putative Zn finger protein [Prosthecobacter fusiformis]